jgi:DNA-binding CsgD family transcriptional regulator
MKTIRSRLALDAIDRIYASTEADGSLDQAIESAATAIDSDKALVVRIDFRTEHREVIGCAGLLPDELELLLHWHDDRDNIFSYCRGWDQDNVYNQSRMHKGPHTYLQWPPNHRLQNYGTPRTIAGVIERTRNTCTILCCYRSAAGRPFSADDAELLRNTMSHWRRALRISSRIGNLHLHSEATHQILDQAPFAIMLVDSDAQVLYANFQASSRATKGVGLSLVNNQLRLDDNAARSRFHEYLRSVAESGSEAITTPKMERIDRPAGKKPIQLMMMPIRPAAEDEDPQTTFAVFAFDPDIRRPIETNALRMLDGLTEAEAKLCESLYDTKNLAETAEQLNVSISTAKTHLLNTFRKLGINSQAELMRHLAHMPKMATEYLDRSGH